MKMKLRLDGQDESRELQLDRIEGKDAIRHQVRCRDSATETEQGSVGPLRWLLVHGRVVRFQALRRGHQIEVWLGGRVYSLEHVDSRTRRAATPTHGAQLNQLTAPMPGTILKIYVAPGESFAPHQPLIIIESMKMEMTISAPHAGRIEAVTCRVGELVQMGAILAKLQETSDE